MANILEFLEHSDNKFIKQNATKINEMLSKEKTVIYKTEGPKKGYLGSNIDDEGRYKYNEICIIKMNDKIFNLPNRDGHYQHNYLLIYKFIMDNWATLKELNAKLNSIIYLLYTHDTYDSTKPNNYNYYLNELIFLLQFQFKTKINIVPNPLETFLIESKAYYINIMKRNPQLLVPVIMIPNLKTYLFDKMLKIAGNKKNGHPYNINDEHVKYGYVLKDTNYDLTEITDETNDITLDMKKNKNGDFVILLDDTKEETHYDDGYRDIQAMGLKYIGHDEKIKSGNAMVSYGIHGDIKKGYILISNKYPDHEKNTQYIEYIDKATDFDIFKYNNMEYIPISILDDELAEGDGTYFQHNNIIVKFGFCGGGSCVNNTNRIINSVISLKYDEIFNYNHNIILSPLIIQPEFDLNNKLIFDLLTEKISFGSIPEDYTNKIILEPEIRCFYNNDEEYELYCGFSLDNNIKDKEYFNKYTKYLFNTYKLRFIRCTDEDNISSYCCLYFLLKEEYFDNGELIKKVYKKLITNIHTTKEHINTINISKRLPQLRLDFLCSPGDGDEPIVFLNEIEYYPGLFFVIRSCQFIKMEDNKFKSIERDNIRDYIIGDIKFETDFSILEKYRESIESIPIEIDVKKIGYHMFSSNINVCSISENKLSEQKEQLKFITVMGKVFEDTDYMIRHNLYKPTSVLDSTSIAAEAGAGAGAGSAGAV
mgnify:FL=1